ncbi:putative T5 A1-like protein [Citromicrobium phage vB_CbaS-RXM]|nr:putative T5 A1-like protein [Citromicrobium phage vB_CbaS-RXM]
MELHEAVKQHGGKRAAARALGIPESTLRDQLKRERQAAMRSFVLPKALEAHRHTDRTTHFIITAAQDKTEIHEDFWNNLQAYAGYLGAEIMIGGFTYSKKLFEENDPRVRSEHVWFDNRIEDRVMHDPIKLADQLIFCAEMNTLPTAVQPLSGLDSYTGSKWGIFPHAKYQLRTIATMKDALSKQIMTTGAVTLPNYIRKKAGVKAQFHHIIGAIVVSVAPDGAFWCRPIQANDLVDGSFYDLDRFVAKGKITTGHRPEALVCGDIHREKLDPTVALTTWGFDVETGEVNPNLPSLSNMLRPKRRIYHDLTDFSARNHHNIKDHHFRYKLHHSTKGQDSVKADLMMSASFLKLTSDADIQDVVIQSNHDNALLKWVKTADAKLDPENYEFWLECELRCIRAYREGRDPFLYEEVMRDLTGPLPNTIFVEEDSSYMVADVELAIHGHYGANGARGSAGAFNKMGPKSITAHTHSPSVTDGHTCVGVNGLMDMGYNVGLSSWLHCDALLYPNGKRALIVMMHGRWFDPSTAQSSLDF